MNNTIATRDEWAEKALLVIDDVATGGLLIEACARHGINPQTFNRTCARLRELSTLYAQAQTLRADLLADEVVSIADSNVDAQKARNRMNARQWLASKLAPKTYGDRLDIAVTQTISVSDALSEARARLLRPVSDLPMVEDAQVVDLPRLSTPASPVEASDAQDEPDIFS